MRKNKIIFVLLLTLLPFIGWAQQKNYYGQHVSIKQTTGDSIQYDLRYNSAGFKPVIRDGIVEWEFKKNVYDYNTDIWKNEVSFSLHDVETIDFRNYEYDSIEVRKALIEFYHAMDGDNWLHHDNWCSDKPIWEWYGVNSAWGVVSEYPWVDYLYLNFNNLSGHIPDVFSKMGPIRELSLAGYNFNCELPKSLGNIYTLQHIDFNKSGIKGTIPPSIGQLPNICYLGMEGNEFDGGLPEELLLALMNNVSFPGNNLDLIDNKFTGKVPESIRKHPRFDEFWPSILIGNTSLDFSDLTIPAPVFTTIDINGNTVDLSDIYKKNKYTLLYRWGLWCPFSLAFNPMVASAYNGYKDKGLDVIGIHYDLHLDDGLADWLKENDIPWPTNCIAKDWDYIAEGYGNPKAALFHMGGTPQVYLVDQNGNIVFNSLMDEKGNNMMHTYYRNSLITYLEDHLGKIDYNFYTSTDYSKDGEVVVLQKATKGNGFDLVFVGEGFTDKDVEDGGRFDQRMSEALDQFFAYEPYKSLQDRFNVYAVKTVSPNAEFYGDATHAIDEDISKALDYASKVTTLIPDRPMHVNVIYNNASGGRSYCGLMEDDSYVCFAMDGVSTVLNHEAGGHGIGKLFDEYVESGNESLSLPEESRKELENDWTTLGWGANVDWRSDPTEVKWSRFISDERYADEKIGLYEGSYLYQYGAYRPTENSMMRYNDTPFNAPSREEIYKRVMKESEGDSWTCDYETFVAFDAPGREQFVSSLSNASRARGDKSPKAQPIQRTAPPVFLKGTWRDALKKK